MPKVEIDGIETYYKEFGPNNEIIPYVLLIHGACQSVQCWEYQLDFLSSLKDFNFIAIDLPGHGQSSGDGFSTISEYSEFLYKFIHKLDIKELILVGHSMGGRISQVFALNYSEFVNGLILVGTGARIKITRAVLNSVENNFEYFCKLASQNSFSKEASDELRSSFYERLLSGNQKTCLNDFIACNEFDVIDSVSVITVPTLIISGADDVLVTNTQTSVLKDKIEKSEMKIIKDAGHFMMMEKPEEFNNHIFDFLSEYKK